MVAERVNVEGGNEFYAGTEFTDELWRGERIVSYGLT